MRPLLTKGTKDFIRNFAPFAGFLLLGSYGIAYMTRPRIERRERGKQSDPNYGSNDESALRERFQAEKLPPEEAKKKLDAMLARDYKEIAEKDTDNWSQVRIPRPGEAKPLPPKPRVKIYHADGTIVEGVIGPPETAVPPRY